MQLSKNFSYEEMTTSGTAKRNGIDNTPNAEYLANMKRLCNEILQPIRDEYGKPMRVSSGFRCDKLNAVVGGSPTSAHKRGCAADIEPSDGNMAELQRVILEWAKTNKFDQIIIEYPKNYIADWIHIGIFNNKGQQRKQILYTTNGKNYYTAGKQFYL